MKKFLLILALILTLQVIPVYAEATSPNKITQTVPTIHYEIKIGIPKITINDKDEKTTGAAFESNGIYMLPVSEMLTVSGYETNVDKTSQLLTTKIGDTTLILDVKANTLSINENKIKLLVEPILKDGHYYMAYNDLKDFVSIKNRDDINSVSFFWEKSDGKDLENKLKNLSEKNIYTFTVGSDIYYKNDISCKISGTIYKKGNNMMIPIRTIAEMMSNKAVVSWHDANKTAYIVYAGNTYEFSCKTNELKVNSVIFKLPSSLELYNGRLYVPEIDLFAIQYFMGNKMDTFDLYNKNENTLSIRV